MDVFDKTHRVAYRWIEETFSFLLIPVSTLYVDSFKSYVCFSKVHHKVKSHV